MKNNRPHIHRIQAFSVLEVTIVIALMALLGALFFGALNRFNEQMANETRIRNELNDWYVVRANLWRELDSADSIRVAKDRAELFFPDAQLPGGIRTVAYFIADNRLFRKTDGTDDKDMRIAMNAIQPENRNGRDYVAFKIDWKAAEMTLRYPLRSTVAANVNQYFTEGLWQ